MSNFSKYYFQYPNGEYDNLHSPYRFGFNGKEKDSEIQGSGNSYDFDARIYDSRLGRWLACDPKHRHNLSSYNFVANNPIIFVDPNGETEYYFNCKWIGTDGVNNGLIAVVSDDKLANEMKNVTKKGQCLPTQKSLPDGYGAVNRNGILIVDYTVLVYANFMLLKQLSGAGSVGEFSLVLHNKNGKFFALLSDAHYKLGDSAPIRPKGSISIHGHTIGLNEIGQYINANVPSSPSVNEETGEMIPGDVDIFKNFNTDIIVGLNGDINTIKDEDGNTLGQTKRKEAINFFDSNSELLGVIFRKQAKKIIEGKRGRLGREFEKNRKATNDQDSNNE